MEPNAQNNEMSLSQKKKFFSFRISPVRHFKHIMIACFFVFLGIIAFHGFVFYKVKFFDMQRNAAGEVLPIPEINENKLETVLSVYGARAQSQEKVSTAPSVVVDPSK